jgi:hypothetical protein
MKFYRRNYPISNRSLLILSQDYNTGKKILNQPAVNIMSTLTQPPKEETKFTQVGTVDIAVKKCKYCNSPECPSIIAHYAAFDKKFFRFTFECVEGRDEYINELPEYQQRKLAREMEHKVERYSNNCCLY